MVKKLINSNAILVPFRFYRILLMTRLIFDYKSFHEPPARVIQ